MLFLHVTDRKFCRTWYLQIEPELLIYVHTTPIYWIDKFIYCNTVNSPYNKHLRSMNLNIKSYQDSGETLLYNGTHYTKCKISIFSKSIPVTVVVGHENQKCWQAAQLTGGTEWCPLLEMSLAGWGGWLLLPAGSGPRGRLTLPWGAGRAAAAAAQSPYSCPAHCWDFWPVSPA